MIRTFIAVELEEACRRALAHAVNKLEMENYPIRWTTPERMHITLKFLGDINPAWTREICEVMREAVTDIDPFAVHVNGLGGFPRDRRLRVLYAHVEDPEASLTRIFEGLDEGLEERVGINKERRRYTPHITLGRTRRNPETTVEEMVALLKSVDFGVVDVDDIVLMQSELSPKGPKYTVLDRAELA